MTNDSSTDLAVDLADALAGEEFYLVYQPEIDLHSGGFAGVEALIRWRHPTRGVVSPAEFVPLLEASGDIVEVGRWALETACYQGAEWHAKGYRFPVSVNTSLQQLHRSAFVGEVERALRASRLEASHLTLEFSHRALGDPETLTTLTTLHGRGVRLAIDNFSPGHPDFSELAAVPVDIVKLDRDFVTANTESPAGASVIHQLVHDARALALRVIASGVEDATQRDHLRDEQVDVGQGFHFARPFEAQEIDRFLQDYALFSGRPL